ncbi:hypothetical protein GCM10010112_42840 [Actinoplanes lobatus]|uniref:Ca2+-binding RTX toxin-like protein n=1 Tax=Actinoplanes lobatus TaxID=113568 RepID=A0A7W7HBU6_9ACTN|nr:calcium-binding protein [Actinoplanes lobatus]MBB4747673.1 Ca2+-binding RTX toxin-like protein [Actinoplanes lobatus]GGN73492.1 hypothetical protein GCM10010112_42840 [Actinoplanes lobatus]GIE39763.1 hypothetical protein Alo02nite_26610 [Actinoplanes lobatus]
MLESSWSVRAGLSAMLTVAAGMLASPAQAASTGIVQVVETTKVQYKAAGGDQNRVVISRSGNTVMIDDVVTLAVGKGCKAVQGDRTRVRCTIAQGPARVQVYTYDRNDSVDNRSDVGLSADGGSGADRLTGGPRGDRLFGGSGADRIWGQGGADTMNGNVGNDVVSGGPGDDVVVGHDGADRLYGGDGHDDIRGYSGNDVLYGGADSDYLFDGPGNDRSYGEGGDDVLDQNWGYTTDSDLLSGGSGLDHVAYTERVKPVTADLDGATGDDGQAGERDSIGADVESLVGGKASDRLTGNGSRNLLGGLAGDDVLIGLGGDDQMGGDQGRDRLYGGAGNDDMYGDIDSATAASDFLAGGDGIDTVSYHSYTAAVSVDLDGATGDDGLAGEHDSVGADVENIYGGAGNDRLTGNAADNYITGGAGNDIVTGYAGNDFLQGEAGLDRLYGGDGDDDLHEQGDTTGTVDLLDGGPHGTRGDGCRESPGDTLVSCEF